ncbi:hypothetical protein C5167_032368 [Papaver somniferum]|uniref:Uncharacterized protein n=1 Tax=Papaver somniferum TaxID=3469 RepID=A0A4Y7KAP3_PAPSO|nr:uncharacterized protein LOC113297316 [Papaver somniferum]RZC69281.1 hypothetical protein C5167_032368 [Papaver somniferum]
MAALPTPGPVQMINKNNTAITTRPSNTPVVAISALAVANSTAIAAASSIKPITIITETPTPTKNKRGLNKPKCTTCGNVARSRCPYESCKNCCAKAQNPCPIHVLKTSGTPSDKSPSSNPTLFEPQNADATTPGTSIRASALRQLSQLNGSQVPRPRKPTTRKEAADINQWRFSKLKEYKDRNIETENEAFDRYMQNVNLLEEAFSLNSSVDGSSADEPTSSSLKDTDERVIHALKAKVGSNIGRTDSVRERIRDIVDQGSRKLQKVEFNDEVLSADADDLDSLKEPKRQKKEKNVRAERLLDIKDVIDKLKKARNEDDLQSCIRMKAQLFKGCGKASVTDDNYVGRSKEQIMGKDVMPGKDLPPKYVTKVDVSQELLHSLDTHFSSLEEIKCPLTSR